MMSVPVCRAILTASLVALLLPGTVSAQSVVRLFLTPAERATLERQRQQQYRPGFLPEIEIPEIIEDLPQIFEEEPEDVIYRVGGSVLRSDGLYTVWLNGSPIDQSNLPDNIQLLEPFAQGALRIRDGESGASFDVKPGQVLNLTTGELFESYQFEEPVEQSVEADGSITESDTDSDTLADQNSDSA